MKQKILIVDDNELLLNSLNKILGSKINAKIYTTTSSKNAIEMVISSGDFSVVITDLDMPDIDGSQLINEIKNVAGYSPEFIVLSGVVSVQQAVGLVKDYGVHSVFPKPFDTNQLVSVIKILLEKSRISRELFLMRSNYSLSVNNLIVESPEMKDVITIADNFAKNDKISILLLGESGTGKSVLAKYIHNNSSRKDGPFIEVNCPTIPESLFESELFGYRKGAFTGADKGNTGKLLLSDGGTIFFDEIAELSLNSQVKLLRFVETMKFWPLGSNNEEEVNARIISATNRDLQKLVKEGKFREDLFYRLNVGTITLPPLRERRSEIKKLIYYYINFFNNNYNLGIEGIEKDALKIFANYPWPGNIRELKNIVERIVILKQAGVINFNDIQITDIDKSASSVYNNKGLSDSVKFFEKQLIVDALKKTGGNKKLASDLLKVKRTTLLEKIKKYNL